MKNVIKNINNYPKARNTLKTKEKLLIPSLICLLMVLFAYNIKANIKGFQKKYNLTPTLTPTVSPKPKTNLPSPTTNLKPTQKPSSTRGGCIVGGCNGEICSDTNMASPCIYKPEFECYKKAKCEKQKDGSCGWTPTVELTACLGASI
jgi:hypothetical protein